jgi:alkylation response protein AidB-like acyl-CoA dehydrogenase
VQELGSLPIILAGNEKQKKKYLPSLARGDRLAAFGLTEPKAGSDVANLGCRAVKKGDEYILNGNKLFITNGGVADIHTIYGVTNPEEKGNKRGSFFIVEKDFSGFRVGKKENKLGIRSSDTVELILEDCRVPAENLLMNEGAGFAISMKTLDFARLGIAAQGLGIASGAFEYATEYAKEREAFGKTINQFQGISFKLADMAIQTEAARQLLYKAAAVFQGLPKDMTRLSPEQVRLSSMAKTFCSDVAMWVTVEAVQVLGGYGYVKEYPVERMMRDAKITQIYEGTNEIQRLIIANSL